MQPHGVVMQLSVQRLCNSYGSNFKGDYKI